MKKTCHTWILRIGLCIWASFAGGLARAQLTSVVPAEYEGSSLEVSSAAGKALNLRFPLFALPEGSTVKAARIVLRVRAASKIPDLYQAVLRLDPSSQWPRQVEKPDDNQVSYRNWTHRKFADSLVLEVDDDFVNANMGRNLQFQLLLASNSDKEQLLPLQGRVPDAGDAPRLVLEFTAPSDPPDWMQVHGGPTQQNRGAMMLTSGSLSGLVARELPCCASLATDPVCHAGRLVVMNAPSLASAELILLDLTTGERIGALPGLPKPSGLAAVSRQGLYHYPTADSLVMVDISNPARPVRRKGLWLGATRGLPNPVTLGVDGVAYLSFDDEVSAYSQGKNRTPAFRYRTHGGNGPMTLNASGSRAYFVAYGALSDPNDDSLHVIRTFDGRRVAARQVAMQPIQAGEGKVYPVLADDGRVFLMDRVANANVLRVLEHDLKPRFELKSASAGGISQPCAGQVKGKSAEMLFLLDGKLHVATAKGSDPLEVLGSMGPLDPGLQWRSCAADMNGHYYGVSNASGSVVHAWERVGAGVRVSQHSVALPQMATLQGGLIPVAQGLWYSRSSSKLVELLPRSQDRLEMTKATASLGNRAVLGGVIIVPEGLEQFGRQTWIATEGVEFSQKVQVNGNLQLNSSGPVSFGPGFGVAKGATFGCTVRANAK